MSERCFVDTNVLLYANDRREAAKQDQAITLIERLLADAAGVISGQVLQEFASVALSKLGQSIAELRVQLAMLARLELVGIDVAVVDRAAELRDRYRINYWDAAILAAAERAGCDILYTEDLNHGQVYGTVRVNNPFA